MKDNPLFDEEIVLARVILAGGSSKISKIGLPYHSGQLCVLGNRQHRKHNGNRQKVPGRRDVLRRAFTRQLQ